uniref:Putative secreted protein n=1 Tax=Anopheles darlingi TaxID=43151 RepID=A0A2M4D6E2_ANODA
MRWEAALFFFSLALDYAAPPRTFFRHSRRRTEMDDKVAEMSASRHAHGDAVCSQKYPRYKTTTTSTMMAATATPSGSPCSSCRIRLPV